LDEIRIQKILSQHGYGSRRECEKYIRDNRVRINGKLAELGQKANPFTDKIELDHRVISSQTFQEIFIAFYKPRKVLSDIKKVDDRRIVTDYVNLDQQFFIVGRLDYDSEGLILLTNNGDIANKLTHPRFAHEKEYHVKLAKIPDLRQLELWRRGVVIAGGYRSQPAIVEWLPKHKHDWIKIILREGKKRQIREIGLTIGLPVQRIIRKRIATIHLGAMKPGEWRFITEKEIRDLKQFVQQKNNQAQSVDLGI